MSLLRFLALSYGFWCLFLLLFFTIRPFFDGVGIATMFLSLLACCSIAVGFGSGK